jgi:hypothetical protein
MEINRNRRNFKTIGKVIDVINLGLSIIIILAVLFLIINVQKYMIMFPVVFLASAAMNAALGFKVYKQRETLHGIILFVVGFFMLVLSIIGFMVAL